MSKVSIAGDSSGTGTFTIKSPNSNTDRTLSLPDQTATLITNSADVLNIGSGQFYKDASGNVGIGTSLPGTSRLNVRGTQSATLGTTAQFTLSSGQGFYLNSETGAINRIAVGTGEITAFNTGSTERARFNSSGEFCIGKTQASETPSTGSGFGFASPNNDPFFSIVNANAAGTNANIYLSKRLTGAVVSINNNNGTTNTGVGAITITASSTSYVTSSDYRLKENVAPMTGALAKVALLKPCNYTWKVDGSSGQGFIAHELQEVVPEAVSGEKDAVNEDGSIKAQGIDTSFLVATLTAAIQELKAIVDAQGAEIAALKGTA